MKLHTKTVITLIFVLFIVMLLVLIFVKESNSYFSRPKPESIMIVGLASEVLMAAQRSNIPTSKVTLCTKACDPKIEELCCTFDSYKEPHLNCKWKVVWYPFMRMEEFETEVMYGDQLIDSRREIQKAESTE